jgi:malonate-semialdehyde dehydrogenase (acetylating)/methylmalonate-semialdehyde dehydrogenase
MCEVMPVQKMWIGGRFTDSVSHRTFPVDNPANERILGRVPRADDRDADRAVDAAAEAFKRWRTVSGLERANLMHQFAARLRDKHVAIAR